ncbi:MAG: Predicted ATPase [uncultured Sulfurovum sp.]|uniref:Predicted ATPase n=1 Tax=uncultured Sulfurovum sp. TaxID=269237 RepID=A0A6S6TWI8_9BACT|nr:MAG: Predicted ATPase [uncultured Sulfurovum sp.]
MKEVFKKLIINFQERTFGRIVSRDYEIPITTKKIVSLIGVRRSGKTYILYSLIEQLRKSIDPKNIVYINFEDDRLFPLKLENLDDLMEGYYELYPEKREEKVYLFLDEVQNVQGWEKYIRRIDDTLNLQLYITGSSSKLLSSEIATSLRGRTITYEVFPFSFKEYLRHKEIEVNLYSSKSVSFVKNAFNSYLVDGGFAETFDETPDVQKRILKDYLDLIIYKDVVERYTIKNQSLLKHLIKYMFVNMGTLISVNKLYNDYKSQGYKVGKDTLYDYMSYLQEAYALFTTPIYRNSVREEQRNPKKLYAIDNGFKKLFSISLSDDYSKLYENLAFLHLRRESSEVYYFKEKQEVDLYVHTDKEYLVNVSYAIEDEKTLTREINALREGMKYFKLSKAYLVTAERDEVVEVDEGSIEVIPMWKWLLV